MRNDYDINYFITDHLGSTRVIIDNAGEIKAQYNYYPFGKQWEDLNLMANTNRYTFSGKEKQTVKDLGYLDFGARMLRNETDPPGWMSIDPLCEKYYSISPYAYCANNPVNYIDHFGLAFSKYDYFADNEYFQQKYYYNDSPVFDRDGYLLGTDDEGLQGEPIIMDKDNFRQGMPHEEAMKHNLGEDGLKGRKALLRFNSIFNDLPNRPDWAGYLTLEEANAWYRKGKGKPLFVALNKIDMSGIVSLGEKYVGQIKSFNLLLYSLSLNDGLVYGSITLKRYPNHQVRAYADKYNFDMHNWLNPFNWGRNFQTIIGGIVAGTGEPYEINIYGSKTLKPKWPWTK
jgi:RHS repeat-associated protein